MKTTLDCIPCLLRQTLEVARLSVPDTADHEKIMRDILGVLSKIDLALSPPIIAQGIHRRLIALTGVEDPYHSQKNRFNRMALDILPALAAKVHAAPQPLDMAVRLAIAGNIIDLGANAGLTEDDARMAIDNVLTESFVGDLDQFGRAVSKAERILYLADNSGEIVIDRLLIEQLRGKHITLAVRGRPIINDATLADARAAGIHDLCQVIDNGSDAPGTVLQDCHQRFRKTFNAADLIIAKGQGNFETLSHVSANIYFLFKVKCPVIASRIGLDMGTHTLVQGPFPTNAATLGQTRLISSRAGMGVSRPRPQGNSTGVRDPSRSR
jgi:uncharacterized protein with ATP-grasp and redox domains